MADKLSDKLGRTPKTKKSRLQVSRKIRFLIKKEGKPRDQAVAIALNLFRRGKL